MFRKLRIYLVNHFGFSRTEANGAIILFFFVISSLLIPKVWISYQQSKLETDVHPSLTAWSKQVSASVQPLENQVVSDEIEDINVKPSFHKFLFDPNKVGKSQLLELGFSSGVGDRILNYRQAGGSFRVPEDLFRIYGVDSTHINDLLPLVKIEAPTVSEALAKPSEVVVKADLNQIGAETLTDVRGIGTVLSNRIIRYRDLLGGYHSFEQLREVYHLHDSSILEVQNHFYLGKENLQTIDINSIGEKDLAKHPYLNTNQARAIVRFRQQHGEFTVPEDLAEVKIVPDTTWRKLSPYLKINPVL